MTRKLPFSRRTAAGVTLIELAITIALVGILAALIAQFVAPVRSYIDSSRRAALADTADTALRRIGRDLRLALPNSARVDPTGRYVEFMLVRTGGRYRADVDPAATNTCTGGYTKDVLNFASGNTCFKTIGNIPNLADVTNSDYVVVFNLQPGGLNNADVYEAPAFVGNKGQITNSPQAAYAGEDRIEINNHRFRWESPGNRFFIIEGPVSYGCDLGTGKLTRYWGYTGFESGQQTPPADGSSALVASGVTACDIVYDVTVAAGTGLITIKLQLTTQDSRGDSESVGLYHAIHVNNVP